MKKVLYCVLSILITYVLQVSAFTYLEIAGIRPNLLLMLTCITGFTMGSRMGLLEGWREEESALMHWSIFMRVH